jgi:hypothetical protein
MKQVWKTLMIIGYVLMGLFAINFFYVGTLYAIRHEGWFFIYNPMLGSHTNSQLALQIVESVVLMLVGWGIISISRKRLKLAG